MDSKTFDRLCDSGFDFLTRSAREIETAPKHALVSFTAGMELLLKARLVLEHWSLIVVGKPDRKTFADGDFTSVGTKEALERLDAIVGEPVPRDAALAFAEVVKHRNRVVHFFHQLEGDAFREAVAKEMCLGWMHLRNRLETWGPSFDRFKAKRMAVESAMRKVRDYLTAVFERVQPSLQEAKRRGLVLAVCPGCRFEAAPIEAIRPPIWSQTCKVCALSVDRLRIECPNCEQPHDINGWDHFQPIQCECGETIIQDDVRRALDESPPEEGSINCGECEGANTVVLHNETYVCIECATHGEELERCDWCGEAQLNGSSLELSYVAGCTACSGRGDAD